MKTIRTSTLPRAAVTLGGLLLIASSCAHVKPEELDRELVRVQNELREEIRQGDEAVEQRLNARIDERTAPLERRLATLEGELNNLREEFAVTIERLENAVRFNAPVHFAFDDDRVRAEDRPVLERFAEVVREYYDGALITVEGFTDPAGDPAYNLRLGERRAESVKSFLVERGLNGERLRTVSYGASADRQVIPGAAGPGGEGWQNRRVALVIDFSGTAPARQPVANDGEDG